MIYTLSRSDRAGKQKLPGFYADLNNADQAAAAQLSIEAGAILATGAHDAIILNRDGDCWRIIDAHQSVLVTIAVEPYLQPGDPDLEGEAKS